jgi:hypothetical protein
MKKICYIALSTLLLLVACKKDTGLPYFGFEYFGLEEGKFVTYEVMEIFHDEALVPANDTFRYVLRTVVGEHNIDNQGRAANKVFRYSFDYQTGDLLDARVWTAIIADSRGEMLEENQRTIRLIFAIRNGKSWDINAYNTLAEKRARYEDVHVAKNINGFELDSTVTVDYDEFLSLVDYVRKYDIYAKDIGLVHRSYKDLRIMNFDTLNIKSGREVHYRLIDYGVE